MSSTVFYTNNSCTTTLIGMIVAKAHNNEDGYLFGMIIGRYYFERKKYEIEFHGDLCFQKQRQRATDDVKCIIILPTYRKLKKKFI